jgi:hypothetical protein
VQSRRGDPKAAPFDAALALRAVRAMASVPKGEASQTTRAVKSGPQMFTYAVAFAPPVGGGAKPRLQRAHDPVRIFPSGSICCHRPVARSAGTQKGDAQ